MTDYPYLERSDSALSSPENVSQDTYPTTMPNWYMSDTINTHIICWTVYFSAFPAVYIRCKKA